MKNFIIILIIVFLFKTENVFSKNSIFDVDNIIIDNKSKISSTQILDKAFEKGFLKLTKKILLNRDLIKVEEVKLAQIQKLVSSYQIINKEDLKEKDQILVNISFDKDKINSFFSEKNISYADISQSNIMLFPVLLEKGNIFLFNNNYFFNNWNKNLNEDKFIDYLLPIESLEYIQAINKSEGNLELIDFKNLLTSYGIKNYILLIIEPKVKSKVFLKGEIYDNQIIKRYNFDLSEIDEKKKNDFIIKSIRDEINELWKLQNLIDIRTPSFLNVKLELKRTSDLINLQKNLAKIDLVENFSVSELNKDYVKVKIKYYGKIDKIKKKFNDNNLKTSIKNNQWIFQIL